MDILKHIATNPSCVCSSGENTILQIVRNPGTQLPRARYAMALTPRITKGANSTIIYCESMAMTITDLMYTLPTRCPPPPPPATSPPIRRQTHSYADIVQGKHTANSAEHSHQNNMLSTFLAEFKNMFHQLLQQNIMAINMLTMLLSKK
jgi:hypothetical protein